MTCKVDIIFNIDNKHKKNIDDVRESPALKIIEDLKAKGALVDYHDPYIKIFPENRIFYVQ